MSTPDEVSEVTPDPLGEISQEDQVQSAEAELTGKAGMVGAVTLLSRLFGLARDSAIAYVLGTRAAADAFYVAFRIPNLLRRLLAEGNLTLSFVPVFTESLKKSKAEAKQVADITFTILLVLLFFVTLLGVLGAGLFVRLTALGFAADPQKFALTVSLTRITFPYIFLVSLGALAMGILNARRKFLVPASAPILLNIGIIFGAFGLSRYFEVPSVGIAWGVIVGGVLQLLIQIPVLLREGFLPRLNFNWRHPAVRKITRLMLPSVYGSAVYQINLLAITFMASYLPTGAVSYLWYADRVIEFPLGVFAISLATVVLPTLSEHAADKNFARMKHAFREALATVWLVNIPAAVGLAVLAEPIIALLFYRGGFTQESTRLTAQALQCFALGLPFVSATRITASAFYAVQEAKKPVRAANWAMVINIVAGFILMWPLGHRGLALGVGIGSTANFLMHIWDYRQQVGSLGLRSLLTSLVKMFLGAVAMAAALLTLRHFWNWTFAPLPRRALFVFAMIAVGATIYFFTVLSFKVEGTEIWRRRLRSLLRRRKKA
ncbi:MAG TPA: murein biosynthesis integral membrane protein MurJ [Deltaproteobacteria bacterium]|nr:murein biosynthesis integral membrane protein MurJ [Deltaproteobacteria bacterium]